MVHVILLLYLVSGFSGVGSLVYLAVRHNLKEPFIKGFLYLHITYTLLMLVSLVLLYLKANIRDSSVIMLWFTCVILLGLGGLTWSLSRFSSLSSPETSSSGWNAGWNISALAYIVPTILYIVLRDTPFALIPVIAAVLCFTVSAVWISIRISRVDIASGFKQFDWLAFVLAVILIIAAEIVLNRYFNLFGEYTVNIPLIFLVWNYLVTKQFYHWWKSERVTVSSFPEMEKRWNITAREFEIIKAVTKGMSNQEIAYDLDISSSTVKNHIYSIYQKTGAKSRVDLANLAK